MSDPVFEEEGAESEKLSRNSKGKGKGRRQPEPPEFDAPPRPGSGESAAHEARRSATAPFADAPERRVQRELRPLAPGQHVVLASEPATSAPPRAIDLPMAELLAGLTLPAREHADGDDAGASRPAGDSGANSRPRSTSVPDFFSPPSNISQDKPDA